MSSRQIHKLSGQVSCLCGAMWHVSRNGGVPQSRVEEARWTAAPPWTLRGFWNWTAATRFRLVSTCPLGIVSHPTKSVGTRLFECRDDSEPARGERSTPSPSPSPHAALPARPRPASAGPRQMASRRAAARAVAMATWPLQGFPSSWDAWLQVRGGHGLGGVRPRDGWDLHGDGRNGPAVPTPI